MGDDRRKPHGNPAQSETPGMPGNSMRENQETPPASGSSTSDRLEKATSYKTSMHVGGESDERVVPAKRSNNGERSPAERVEGSRSITVRWQTVKKRLRSKPQAVRQELRKRWHERIAETGDWLRSVVQGYFNYHAVPGNFAALRRRSQRHRLPWERFRSILDRYLPLPRILHPEPGVRFDARHPR